MKYPISITSDLLSNESDAFVQKSDREEIVKALEVGISVVSRYQQSKDLDYVNAAIQKNMIDVSKAIDTMLVSTSTQLLQILQNNFDPSIATSYTKRFGEFMNVEAKAFKEVIQTGLSSVKEDMKRIDQNTNESDASILGRTRKVVIAVQEYIVQQFDGKNTESYAYRLSQELTKAISILDETVKRSITEQVRAETAESTKSIVAELTAIRELIAKEQGKAEIFELTSNKGFVFEEKLFSQLEEVAKSYGDIVEASGLTKDVSGSQKGDFIYITQGQKIIIEAKDKPVMLKESVDYVKQALSSRGSSFGILVSKLPEQLQKQIGRWNVYDNIIICCADDIEISIKYARFKTLLTSVKSEGVNIGKITTHLNKLADEIKKFGNAKTNLTNIKKAVDTGTTNVSTILDEIQASMKIIIQDIQDEIEKGG